LVTNTALREDATSALFILDTLDPVTDQNLFEAAPGHRSRTESGDLIGQPQATTRASRRLRRHRRVARRLPDDDDG
jgi:hypothetical protein